MEGAPSVQFTKEVETLLRTTLWPEALFSSDGSMGDAISFDARTAAYVTTLRLIARQRSQQRRNDLNFNPQERDEWNQQFLRQQLGKIGLDNRQELRMMARRVALANMAKTALNEPKNFEMFSGVRRQYLEDIIDFVQQAPARITVKTGEGISDVYKHGALINAPTGFGKTALMGAAARILKVGYPIEGIEGDDEPISLLLTAPENVNLDQLTGAVGDKTFQQFSNGLRVGRYTGCEKEIKQFSAIGTTVDRFEMEFRNGKLGDQSFDLLMIDEAHCLTGPLFQDTFLHHWDGPAFGFTATPEYHTSKDARRILPYHIHHTDIISCIEDGLLNSAQLFTIKVEPDSIRRLLEVDARGETEGLSHELLDKAAIDLVVELVSEGRRGMIFCDQGDSSFFARQLAQKLNRIRSDNGKRIRAAAIGSFKGARNRHVIDSYNAGDLDVITTVHMASQSFNSEVDLLLSVGWWPRRLK